MVKRRIVKIAVVTSLIVFALAGLLAAPVAAEEGLYHTVLYGQTLSGIARMYGLSIREVMDANGIANANLIYAGQRLTIPVIEMETAVHVVAAGEQLLTIAAKYGVTVRDIAIRNGIWNTNLIFPGQRLVIPGGAQPEPAPPIGTPNAQEAIVIESPELNAQVSSPVTVTGWGSGFENTLAVDILDAMGNAIGQGYVIVDAEFGQYGTFTGTIEFTAPAEAQLGRIQVYSISPRDGAIDHLASVTVNLQP